MSSQLVSLFTAQTTNANGTATICDLTGTGQLVVYGTFDSATFKLQTTPDGTTWIDVPNTTVTTATAGILIRCSQNEQVRGVLSGGGANMSITAIIRLLVNS